MERDRNIDDRPAPRRLMLELQSDGAGVAGSIYDELGDQHSFTGWLGLLTLLEAARLRSQHARLREAPRRQTSNKGGDQCVAEQ